MVSVLQKGECSARCRVKEGVGNCPVSISPTLDAAEELILGTPKHFFGTEVVSIIMVTSCKHTVMKLKSREETAIRTHSKDGSSLIACPSENLHKRCATQ